MFAGEGIASRWSRLLPPRLLAPIALALALLAPISCHKQSARGREPRRLVVLMGADVTTLDPDLAWDNVSMAVLDNIYETLVRFDDVLRLEAGLAPRWINPDDRTWRFFLDAGARFSDGSPLRASDVKSSIERLQSLPGSDLVGLTDHITGVGIVDDLTVDVHTDTPVAILNSVAFIPIVNGARLGTGPYRLVRREAGRSILLEANEHHRPLPPVRRAEFLVRDGDRIVDEVLAIRPDLTLFFRLSKLPELKARRPPEIAVAASGGLAVFYAAVNLRSRVPGLSGPNPLEDVRVRRALARATDQEEIIRRALQGFGRPATQPVVPEVFGFDPGISRAPYDPEAARIMLKQAGHAAFEVPIVAERGRSHLVETIIIEQWARVGVRGVLKELGQEELQKALENGAFGIVLRGYGCTSGDASEVITYALHSRDVARGQGKGNFTGFKNAELDRIAEDNLRTLEPRKRLGPLQRALRLSMEDGPYIPLYAVSDVYLVSNAVQWTPKVNGEIRVSDVSFRPGAEDRRSGAGKD